MKKMLLFFANSGSGKLGFASKCLIIVAAFSIMFWLIQIHFLPGTENLIPFHFMVPLSPNMRTHLQQDWIKEKEQEMAKFLQLKNTTGASMLQVRVDNPFPRTPAEMYPLPKGLAQIPSSLIAIGALASSHHPHPARARRQSNGWLRHFEAVHFFTFDNFTENFHPTNLPGLESPMHELEIEKKEQQKTFRKGSGPNNEHVHRWCPIGGALSIASRLYDMYPNSKWFFVIDDDTYTVPSNLVDYLTDQLAGKEEYYIMKGRCWNVSPKGCSDKHRFPKSGKDKPKTLLFPQGGPGVILSRGLLKKMRPIIDSCREKRAFWFHSDTTVGACATEAIFGDGICTTQKKPQVISRRTDLIEEEKREMMYGFGVCNDGFTLSHPHEWEEREKKRIMDATLLSMHIKDLRCEELMNRLIDEYEQERTRGDVHPITWRTMRHRVNKNPEYKPLETCFETLEFPGDPISKEEEEATEADALQRLFPQAHYMQELERQMAVSKAVAKKGSKSDENKGTSLLELFGKDPDHNTLSGLYDMLHKNEKIDALYDSFKKEDSNGAPVIKGEESKSGIKTNKGIFGNIAGLPIDFNKLFDQKVNSISGSLKNNTDSESHLTDTPFLMLEMAKNAYENKSTKDFTIPLQKNERSLLTPRELLEKQLPHLSNKKENTIWTPNLNNLTPGARASQFLEKSSNDAVWSPSLNKLKIGAPFIQESENIPVPKDRKSPLSGLSTRDAWNPILHNMKSPMEMKEGEKDFKKEESINPSLVEMNGQPEPLEKDSKKEEKSVSVPETSHGNTKLQSENNALPDPQHLLHNILGSHPLSTNNKNSSFENPTDKKGSPKATPLLEIKESIPQSVTSLKKESTVGAVNSQKKTSSTKADVSKKKGSQEKKANKINPPLSFSDIVKAHDSKVQKDWNASLMQSSYNIPSEQEAKNTETKQEPWKDITYTKKEEKPPPKIEKADWQPTFSFGPQGSLGQSSPEKPSGQGPARNAPVIDLSSMHDRYINAGASSKNTNLNTVPQGGKNKLPPGMVSNIVPPQPEKVVDPPSIHSAFAAYDRREYTNPHSDHVRADHSSFGVKEWKKDDSKSKGSGVSQNYQSSSNKNETNTKMKGSVSAQNDRLSILQKYEMNAQKKEMVHARDDSVLNQKKGGTIKTPDIKIQFNTNNNSIPSHAQKSSDGSDVTKLFAKHGITFPDGR